MPPKRLHEQFDNDTGEGTSNIKKIRIVRGADEGVKKIGIVRGGDDDDEGIMCEDCSQILYSAASLARHKEMVHGRETEKFICFDCGQLRFMERRHNYRCNRSLVGKYKGKRSKASFDLWNLRSLQLMAKTRNKNGKFCLFTFLDPLLHLVKILVKFIQ